ncbi:MAG: Rid family detoxifying hydrolase [Spirochaetes bacterium]|nr:Rid family detoxifying hydrolase [Spirochaetota bacterium]
MKKVIYTKNGVEPIGPYSQAVHASGELLFISGQIPIDPKTNSIDRSDIEGQTEQVMQNIRSILKHQNLNFSNVIKCEVFLQNINDFSKFNDVYAEFFKKGDYPARAVVEVSKLPKNVLIEISAIAVY